MESLILAGVICSLFFSMLSFGVMLFMWFEKRTADKSTHTIEYRDPFQTYPDELNLEKNGDKVSIKEFEPDPDMQSDETISDMNKFIKEEGVLL